jgi:hypothetical protein
LEEKVMIKRIRRLALILSSAVLFTCSPPELKNEADIDYRDQALKELSQIGAQIRENAGRKDVYYSFAEKKKQEKTDELMTDVRTTLNNAATGTFTTTAVRPRAGQTQGGVSLRDPQACCWAHSQAAQLAPDDEGGANTWGDNCLPTAAVDNDNDTWWNSNYTRGLHDNKNTNDGGRHWITLDLGTQWYIVGLVYRGRGSANSRINEYQIYVSDVADLGRDPENTATGDHPGHRPSESKMVATGNFASNANEQTVGFSGGNRRVGRYVQLRALSHFGDTGGGDGAAELRVQVATTTIGGTAGRNLLETALATVQDKIDSLDEIVKAAIAEAARDPANGFDWSIDFDGLVIVAGKCGEALAALKAKDEMGKYYRLNAQLDAALSYVSEENVAAAPKLLDNLDDPSVFFDYQDKINNIALQLLEYVKSAQ